MNVKTLIEQLSVLDPNLEVLISSDPEGNSFSRLAVVDADNNAFSEESRDLDVGLMELTDDLALGGFTQEDVVVDGTPCVILWP